MAAYPRKQTVVIFILCAFAVGGVASYVSSQSSQVSAASGPVDLALIGGNGDAQTAEASANADWQKQFINTSATSSAFKTSGATKAVPEKLTPTDVLGRNFLTQYMALRQTGANNDPTSVVTAMDQAIMTSVSSMPPPKAYTLKELNIVSDTSAVRAAYGGVVESIIRSYSAQRSESDAAMQAFNDGDMDELSALDPIIGSYQAIIRRLLAVPVPSSFAADHLSLTNGFSMLLYSSQAFRNIDTDATTALSAARVDKDAIDIVSETSATIKNRLNL